MERRPMPISPLWLQAALLTYLLGFTVLGLLAYLTYAHQPPLPGRTCVQALLHPNRALSAAPDTDLELPLYTTAVAGAEQK